MPTNIVTIQAVAPGSLIGRRSSLASPLDGNDFNLRRLYRPQRELRSRVNCNIAYRE
jgi:hypothetical protein